ncbi:hypothetical protein N5C62_22320 [Pseudomonas atacamensis]|uniref:hypothetical protein n=1 Tax=Pseudomonas atacamensis TaxID=2565368 RepID=UPI002448F72F|nr:hypothetical protein [Pseudomonas atacamensis]MDH1260408.1 hypothetical protein [Pseudomonas atacamensis]
MNIDEKLRLRFTDEQWLEIEVQAASMKMSIRDYLRMVLRQQIVELIDESRPADTLH